MLKISGVNKNLHAFASGVVTFDALLALARADRLRPTRFPIEEVHVPRRLRYTRERVMYYVKVRQQVTWLQQK